MRPILTFSSRQVQLIRQVLLNLRDIAIFVLEDTEGKILVAISETGEEQIATRTGIKQVMVSKDRILGDI